MLTSDSTTCHPVFTVALGVVEFDVPVTSLAVSIKARAIQNGLPSSPGGGNQKQ